MKNIVINPSGVKEADIIVGVPSYNEADSIAYPVDMASRGLVEHFSSYRSVIINVDNNSPDGTKDVFLNTPTKVPKVYISTPPGVKGKGNNFRNLFKAAVELKAKAIIVVDADLKSITPNWIRYLGEPLLGRFDFVTPIYIRHKYDGTITNHIAYPMLRTLFGIRIRQPIGGDFGFSGKLARAFLSEKLWNEKISQFGIDIWMTTIAVARHFNVCQAFLGTPKIHRVKDPSKDLSEMFTQVVSTIFDLMIDFEYLWKATFESRPSNIYGFGLGVEDNPPEVKVDVKKLFKNFFSGYRKYKDIWKQVIPVTQLREIERLLSLDEPGNFYYSTLVWARILFDYAVAYKNNDIDRNLLLLSFIPLYHSRVLSYVNKTKNMKTREAEEYLENITRVFEREKYYLIERWEEAERSRGEKFFS